jgi:hypothetical protein
MTAAEETEYEDLVWTALTVLTLSRADRELEQLYSMLIFKIANDRHLQPGGLQQYLKDLPTSATRKLDEAVEDLHRKLKLG